MKFKLISTIMVPLWLVTLITTPIGLAAPPTQPSNFADPAFKSAWTRTDELVSSGQVKRSYYWGPSPVDVRPIAGGSVRSLYEEYDEGPNGMRLVQYFDKSRMEINNPNGDKSSTFYVTNGLLAIELMSGNMRVGDSKIVERYPANIPMTGDSGDILAPTYAVFAKVANASNDHRQGDRTGLADIDAMNNYGIVTKDATKNG